jgi:hypothetical protein
MASFQALGAPHHSCLGAGRGVSKGVEDSCSPPALRASHTGNRRKGVSGVARPQGVDGSSMVGPVETLGSP